MNNEELLHETEELRARLEEAEATIQAIQTGEVDALIVSGPGGDKVFALEGADYAYRVIVEAMSEGVVTLSTDGGILSCNSRFAHFVKVPMEQIPGKPLASFAAEGETPKLGAFLKKAAKINCATTITLTRSDGTTMPANLSAGALEVGGFSALCVVIMDLTEMYVATETRMLLASIVETSYDAVISTSLDNLIVTWNAAAERIYGFSAQEAVGRPISLIMPRDYIQEVEMIGGIIHLEQRLEGYETLHITKLGAPIQVSLTVSPLMDPNGNITGVSVIARDITEHKKSEEELARHRQHLEEMVRQRTGELEISNAELRTKIAECKQTEVKLLETERRIQNLNKALEAHVATVDAVNTELESYSHSVSHDLRTPLRFVNRIAHVLLQEPGAPLTKVAAEQVNMILQATGEMGQLIEKLLAFSQANRVPIKKRSMDLRRLFHEVERELSCCDAEIEIQELPLCRGDRTLLKEVVVNLLENALKFTRRREKARITIGCTEKDGETAYFVKDNGVGFDMSKLDSLFVPFHRLHSMADFEGTGIGLALVKRIIERHDGRIWAEGEVDKGATFYFTLGNEAAE